MGTTLSSPSDSLPQVEKDYPPPSLSSTTKEELLQCFKEDFTKIRHIARKAPKECLDSFDNLASYLQKEGVTTELAKVRFFFEWLLISRQVPALHGLSPAAELPVWLGRCQRDSQMYTDFFTLLCRSSGVKCAIIKGYLKGAGFEEENVTKRNCPRGRWVAVHVEGEWRFINPPWAFFSATQSEDKNSDRFVLVERDTDTFEKKDENASARTQTSATTEEKPGEFWFLTDPPTFNAFCHAEDSKWQLLDSVWTDKEFFQKPKYTEEYFKSSKWQLLIEESGVLKAEKGKCIICYTHPESATTAYLKYNLYMKNAAQTALQDQPKLSRFVVFEYIGKGQINLIARLPHNGLYKIEIAGVLDGDLQPLNEFVINAVNVPKKPEPFPESCQDLGVLPEARQLGVAAKEERGIVLVPQRRTERGTERRLELQFSVAAEPSEAALSAFLTHCYKKDEEIQKFVKIETTKNDVNKKADTTMTFCLSEDDDKSPTFEYCLTILKGAVKVIRYILTGDKELTFPRENAIIQDKTGLLSAIRKSNISEVEKMLSKCDFNSLDPSIRHMITSLRQPNKKRKTLPAITDMPKDSQAQPEITNEPQRPDKQGKARAEPRDSRVSEVEEAVWALRLAMKNNNNATHQADLESALAVVLGLGVQRGDYDGVIDAAEPVLIKLYEVELKRCVRKNIRKEIEAAVEHADTSCIAYQIKETEAYINAAKLPVLWR